MSKFNPVHLNKEQKNDPKKTLRVEKPQVKPAQIFEAPETLRPEEVLQAQQQVGNQVVQRALDKNGRDQSLTDGQGNLRHDLSAKIQQKRGGGSPLPDKVQQEVTEKFGRKFDSVRIHTDESADKLSRSLHARAFTIGRDIFFKNGVFAPSSSAGRETLLHELTHVVQQSGKGSNGSLKLGAPDSIHEKEANRIGKSSSSIVSSTRIRGGSVQKQGEEEEIQAQSDEEEIQTQMDEEEVQMEGDEEDPNIPKAPKMTPKMQLEAVSQEAKKMYTKEKKPSLGEKIKGAFSGAKRAIQTKVTGVDPESLQGQLKAQAGKLRSVKGSGIKDIEKAQSEKFNKQSKSGEATIVGEGKDAKASWSPSAAEKQVTSREKLMGTIRNASSKPEDIKAAQEKLNLLHKRSKWDTFKSFFKKGGSTKSYADQAMEQRRSSLLQAAKGGDEEAYKKYKGEEEEREKNSTGSKIKGALKGALGGIVGKVGGMIGGAVGGMAKKQVAEYKSHFMGKSEEEDDKEKKGDKEEKGEEKEDSGKSSSNMGSGIGAMMEKYGELVKENMALKQKLQELGAK